MSSFFLPAMSPQTLTGPQLIARSPPAWTGARTACTPCTVPPRLALARETCARWLALVGVGSLAGVGWRWLALVRRWCSSAPSVHLPTFQYPRKSSSTPPIRPLHIRCWAHPRKVKGVTIATCGLFSMPKHKKLQNVLPHKAPNLLESCAWL